MLKTMSHLSLLRSPDITAFRYGLEFIDRFDNKTRGYIEEKQRY